MQEDHKRESNVYKEMQDMTTNKARRTQRDVLNNYKRSKATKRPKTSAARTQNDRRDAQGDHKETKMSTKRNKKQLQTKQENHGHSKHPRWDAE